jgi:hypothetical protein
MPRASGRLVTTLVSALALIPIPGAAQHRPDFSGDWVLAEALATGPGRDASAPGTTTARPTTSTTISGAPFNCGIACTIVHKGQALTILNANLPDYPGKDKSRPTPSVTLHLDGRQLEVVDSFSPSRRMPVTAQWQGDRVRIESRSGRLAMKQVLSLEQSRLVVASTAELDGQLLGQTTFTYRRK